MEYSRAVFTRGSIQGKLKKETRRLGTKTRRNFKFPHDCLATALAKPRGVCGPEIVRSKAFRKLPAKKGSRNENVKKKPLEATTSLNS